MNVSPPRSARTRIRPTTGSAAAQDTLFSSERYFRMSPPSYCGTCRAPPGDTLCAPWRNPRTVGEKQQYAGVGFDDVQEYAYGGSFSCAIRSHQAEHLTSTHCERELTNHLSIAESLGGVLCGDCFHARYPQNAKFPF